MTKLEIKKWLAALALSSALMVFTHSSFASAFDSHKTKKFYHSTSSHAFSPKHRSSNNFHTKNDSRSSYRARELSKNGGKVRSRSDAVSEVKRKYPNCEILKVKLDERKMVYRVRILTSKGRVSVISINANR